MRFSRDRAFEDKIENAEYRKAQERNNSAWSFPTPGDNKTERDPEGKTDKKDQVLDGQPGRMQISLIKNNKHQRNAGKTGQASQPPDDREDKMPFRFGAFTFSGHSEQFLRIINSDIIVTGYTVSSE